MPIESAVPEVSIRERAYAIWEQEGRPEGRELDHWIRAIREVAEPFAPSATPVKLAAPVAEKRMVRGRSRKAANRN
jgi:hypothetical protein